ncbi:hypothetical protein QBC43DRAFT_363150 [Cladorrhinum sp. PSN259]|nr:hypothetical protein QBC43DRAFT_363150 [Cladorrhinum sp. PSN259]
MEAFRAFDLAYQQASRPRDQHNKCLLASYMEKAGLSKYIPKDFRNTKVDGDSQPINRELTWAIKLGMAVGGDAPLKGEDVRDTWALCIAAGVSLSSRPDIFSDLHKHREPNAKNVLRVADSFVVSLHTTRRMRRTFNLPESPTAEDYTRKYHEHLARYRLNAQMMADEGSSSAMPIQSKSSTSSEKWERRIGWEFPVVKLRDTTEQQLKSKKVSESEQHDKNVSGNKEISAAPKNAAADTNTNKHRTVVKYGKALGPMDSDSELYRVTCDLYDSTKEQVEWMKKEKEWEEMDRERKKIKKMKEKAKEKTEMKKDEKLSDVLLKALVEDKNDQKLVKTLRKTVQEDKKPKEKVKNTKVRKEEGGKIGKEDALLKVSDPLDPICVAHEDDDSWELLNMPLDTGNADEEGERRKDEKGQEKGTQKSWWFVPYR